MTHKVITDTLPHLGYFLEYRYWKNAYDLLEYQLSLKPDNKHFNTLSMFYYERLDTNDKKQITTEPYFNERVVNNLLYGLQKEFTIHSYPIPKSNLGLRKYRFFAYPMRLAYYAVGLYLLQLSQDLILQYYKLQPNIHSDYGGNLRFNEATGDLLLNYDSVWYKTHYRRFRRRMRSEIKGDVTNKIVIQVDIQNYFEEIVIPRLLNFLTDSVKPSIQREMKFDSIAKGQLIAFFDSIAGGRTGIPQTDNDVVSSFLGNLYLIFNDLLLDQEINKDHAIIKSHSVIRYMDDMYVCVTFHDDIPMTNREIYINQLAARIADILYTEFSLRLNTKTQLYWLNRDEDKEKLLKSLKRVSPGYELPDDDDKTHPQKIVDLIFTQLGKLKKRALDPTFDERSELDDEILKQVYDKSVNNILRSEPNQKRINDIFQGFNFDLVIAQPREILIILLIDPDATQRFTEFLLKKQNLSSRDIYLVLSFLCQTDFRYSDLVSLLGKTVQMKDIIDLFVQAKIETEYPGYFSLNDKQTLKLKGYTNVIEQMRLRIQCERQGEYSVALNHLLNEIHAICYHLDMVKSPTPIAEKAYDATKVVKFLESHNVPHSICLKIRNLFDRRNKNPVSHPDQMAWPVSKEEYLSYQKQVGACLNHLL